jgi:plastocyanin
MGHALLGVAIAAALSLGVACGSAESPDFSGQVPEGAPHVNQDALRFKPNELTVPAGELVYFTNSESAVHNVTFDGEDLSGTLNKGDVFAYSFADPGEYQLTCTFHPQMKVTITVE